MFGTIKNFSKVWQAKALWTLVLLFGLGGLVSFSELFLAHTGVNYEKKSNFINRHLYRVSGLFYQQASFISQNSTASSQTQTIQASPLTSWSLQALYQEGKDGFAIVLVSGKAHFLNIGESLEGYNFYKIEDKTAYFRRSGKTYKLSLALSGNVEIINVKEDKPLGKEHINIDALQSGIVSRDLISRRIKQPHLIWKDIKISIYKAKGEIKGFIVRSVAHNSVFHHMGLRRGDIIVSANGETFNSIEQVQDLYKNIDKIHSVVLGVKRSGKIKEISYEIR